MTHGVGQQLDRDLAYRPLAGEQRPEKIDARTLEGKRWKAVLLAEAIELREQGFTLEEIAAAVKINPGTLSVWMLVSGRMDLCHARLSYEQATHCAGCGKPLPQHSGRGRPRKYCNDGCIALKTSHKQASTIHAARLEEEVKARRVRINQIRARYRKLRAAGKPLPWHVLREEPVLTVEQKAELHKLKEMQDRDRDVIGRRPWLISADAPLGWGENPDDPGDFTVMDSLYVREERYESEIEQMMIENGLYVRRHIPTRPWRTRRPVREMYPDLYEDAA